MCAAVGVLDSQFDPVLCRYREMTCIFIVKTVTYFTALISGIETNYCQCLTFVDIFFKKQGCANFSEYLPEKVISGYNDQMKKKRKMDTISKQFIRLLPN